MDNLDELRREKERDELLRWKEKKEAKERWREARTEQKAMMKSPTMGWILILIGVGFLFMGLFVSPEKEEAVITDPRTGRPGTIDCTSLTWKDHPECAPSFNPVAVSIGGVAFVGVGGVLVARGRLGS